MPSSQPTALPTAVPSSNPTAQPIANPTSKPTNSKAPPRVAKGIHPGVVVLGFVIAIILLQFIYFVMKPRKSKASLASLEIKSTQHGAASSVESHSLALEESEGKKDKPILV